MGIKIEGVKMGPTVTIEGGVAVTATIQAISVHCDGFGCNESFWPDTPEMVFREIERLSWMAAVRDDLDAKALIYCPSCFCDSVLKPDCNAN